MALGLSIPGAGGSPPLTFTVLGQEAGNQAAAFSADVAGLPQVVLGPDTTPSAASLLFANASSQVLDVISGTVGGSYTLTSGDNYLADLATVPTTVNGSATGGETVMALGGVTWNDGLAGGNAVTFINGNGVFNGSTVAGAAGDTIWGSAGFDTINTGTNYSTVYGGAGHTLINLNDTITSIANGFGGTVYLEDGNSTVNANGTLDAVITGVSGQLIQGGTDASAFLDVIIASKDGNLNFGGNDTVNAGAGITTVFDTIGGDTISGGSGILFFVGGVRPGAIVADTINAGSGASYIYAGANESLTLTDSPASGLLIQAGDGNETLNGAGAAGAQYYFTDTNTVNAATDNTHITGGNVYNYFEVGTGNETITGGTGTNVFDLTASDGHTVINDFTNGSLNYVLLGSTENAAAVEASETVSGGNLTLKLSDNSVVTFTGVTDINSFNSHIVGGS